jgi:hypothetical protein
MERPLAAAYPTRLESVTKWQGMSGQGKHEINIASVSTGGLAAGRDAVLIVAGVRIVTDHTMTRGCKYRY